MIDGAISGGYVHAAEAIPGAILHCDAVLAVDLRLDIGLGVLERLNAALEAVDEQDR